MNLYKLSKTPFLIKNNAASFLNGLASNEIDVPNNAFLSIHGRIIATFDQLKLSDDEVLIVIETPFVEAAFAHLDRYIKLSGAVVEPIQANVYFDCDADASATEDDFVIPQHQGQLFITKRDLEANVSDQDFALFRLKGNIPIQGIDYTDEFLLNVSTTDFVSFTKGCFLGQEPVSKVYNRSKPTWQLCVRYEDECSEEEKAKMTSKAPDESGRTLGFVFVKQDKKQ